MEQTFLTLNEIQDRYGVSRQTVTNWINKASFPTPIRVGRSKRWNMNDICAWEKSNRIETTTEAAEDAEIWQDDAVAETLKTALLHLIKVRDALVQIEPKIQNRGLHRKVLDVTKQISSARELVNDIQGLKGRGLTLDYPTDEHVDDDLF